jgi:hypothetical protein
MGTAGADFPIESRELVQILAENVTDEAVRRAGGNVNDYTPWTKLIFSVLRELTTERGGVPVFTCDGESEFMLDFVWLHRDDYGSHIKTALAVEIEWASKFKSDRCITELALDFRKLLCFKAPLKLFIFDCPEQASKASNEMLERYLETFTQHTKGECYVLIEFYKNKQKRLYEQRSHIWCVSDHGVKAERYKEAAGIAK